MPPGAVAFDKPGGPGLVVVAPAPGAAASLHVRHATWIVGAVGRTQGAVFGPVTAVEAGRIVAALTAAADPRDAPDVPWAAAALRPDGTVAVTASMMLTSGLFHTDVSQAHWIVATDPAAAAGPAPTIDYDFLAGFTVLVAAPDGTPFAGVHRLPAGDTLLRHPDGTVTTATWCGPGTLPAPTRCGPTVLSDYLAAFDAVVADLAARAGPPVTTLSGGLDSTFVVASLARAARAGGTDGPIRAYCHTPLPAALTRPTAGWDPDDFPHAAAFAAAYSDVVHLEALRNDALRHPLDVAAAYSRARGWPCSGVANIVWLDDFDERAAVAGAALRFFGTQGNASFSSDHRYAARYYISGGHPWRAARLASASMRGDGSWWSAFRSRVLAPLRPPRPEADGIRRAALGLPPAPSPRRPTGRDVYLAWLTGRLRSLPAVNNPAPGGPLVADPFASRTIIELAASIAPDEWQRGHADRALARRLGAGRIPDTIRLRTRRGGQGRDTVYLLRRTPDRLLDGIAAVPDGVWEALGIDSAVLAASARTVLAGDSAHPALVGDLLRTVAAAEFAAAYSR